jgi:hypothetical protein
MFSNKLRQMDIAARRDHCMNIRHGEQEPGHLERLENGPQLTNKICERSTREGHCVWFENPRAVVANLPTCREADISPGKT